MDKTRQLLIRACKSKNPDVRLKSVYRRRYYGGKIYPRDMCIILASICDEHLDLKASYFLGKLNHSQSGLGYMGNASVALRDAIRFARKDRFEGLTAPARFRRG